MSKMDFEAQLTSIAREMDYPRTPDIATRVSARLRSSVRPRLISKTLAWSLTIALILLSSLMLIPSARAAIIEFIQIGVVRIFRAEPTPIPTLNEEAPQVQILITATPALTPQPLIAILQNLGGETTLARAQEKVPYPILLPSYPADLGQPDYVFVQAADGFMTILVWTDPQNPDEVLMSLHFLPSGSWAIKKMEPTVIQETKVNDQRAVWTTGPYPLQITNGDIRFTRLVDGHVLIWEDGNVTYRLEIDSSLEEAVKIAESLEPIK